MDINQILYMPDIEYVICDGYHILYNSKNANYIITNVIGIKVFYMLKNKKTVKEIFNSFYKEELKDVIDFLTILDKKKMLNEKPIRDINCNNKYPSYLHIHLTNYCNYFCKHCYMSANSSINTANELSLEELKNIIHDFLIFNKNSTKCAINFSGGEATKSANFLTLIQYSKEIAKKENIDLYLYLITNGSSFTDINFLKAVKQYIDRVHISVDACTEEVFDKIRGKGTFVQTIKGINNALNNDMKVILNFTLMKDNINDYMEHIDDLLSLIQYPEKLMFSISKAFEMGRAQSDMIIDADELFKVKCFLLQKLNKVGNFKSTINEPLKESCGFGGMIALYPNGDLKYCVSNKNYNDLTICNIRNDNFKEIIEKRMKSLLTDTCVDKLNGCQTCPIKYLCAGNCRLDNIFYNGNPNNVYCPSDVKKYLYQQSFRKLIYQYIVENNNIELNSFDNTFVLMSDGLKSEF